jgi:Tfp pilus assembly PilM family ATPase
MIPIFQKTFSRISKEERVGGLVIREGAVEFSSYRQSGAGLVSVSVALPQKTIMSGRVVRREDFRRALAELRKKSKTAALDSVIVSAPSSLAHWSVFDFPSSVSGEQLSEAVRLAGDSSFPFPASALSVDTAIMEQKDAGKTSVLVGFMKREDSEEYASLVTEGGFSVVALETHGMSAARVSEGEEQKTRLTVFFEPSEIVITASDRGLPVFQVALPREAISRKVSESQTAQSDASVIALWVERAAHSLLSGKSPIRIEECVAVGDDEEISKVAPLIQSPHLPKFTEKTAIKKDAPPILAKEPPAAAYVVRLEPQADSQSRVANSPSSDPHTPTRILPVRTENLGVPAENSSPETPVPSVEKKEALVFSEGFDMVASGVALRMRIPRKDDKIISFLPLGTQEAYFRSELVSLFDFFQKASISFGLFLIAVFAGSFGLLHLIESEKSQSVNEALPSEFETFSQFAESFNSSVAALAALEAHEPRWEALFSEIDKLRLPGISFRRIDVSLGERAILVEGTSAHQDALLLLKARLESSNVFTFDPLPLKIFLEKENIPFTLKLRLKDQKTFFP